MTYEKILFDTNFYESFYVPSLDPTIAPPGKHVCLLFTQYTPYTLKNGDSWHDEVTREKYADLIFDTIEEYAPGFKKSIGKKNALKKI